MLHTVEIRADIWRELKMRALEEKRSAEGLANDLIMKALQERYGAGY